MKFYLTTAVFAIVLALVSASGYGGGMGGGGGGKSSYLQLSTVLTF